MICHRQSLYLFLLLIQCAWSIVAPDHLSQSASFNKHYKRDSNLLAATKQYDFMIAQEYSWQRLQTNKYGVPKCAEQNNQCRQIGIIGVCEVSFFDKF
jgi:hypothetical protein